MQDRERLRYRTAIAVLVALCLYLGWRWLATVLESQEHYRSELMARRWEEERLKGEVARLQRELDQAKSPPFLALSPLGIAELNAKGLDDPVADLVADLQTRTDLIPFQPIAGGRTHIGAWLINSDWVLAGVGDGHRGMWALLHYEVESGEIKWTLLATGP